jgi:hypothetical protein
MAGIHAGIRAEYQESPSLERYRYANLFSWFTSRPTPTTPTESVV